MDNSNGKSPSVLTHQDLAPGTAATVGKNCGIIMPISECDGLGAAHWSEVRAILCDAIASAGLAGSIVSETDDVGVIHKRIIQRLYSDPIVVCDVSGRNANVMFELGLRLAFDKPTIIVKDRETKFAFDTQVIQHLLYPRDLRYSAMVAFKADLKKKIETTLQSANDPGYSTFLKNFGTFTVPKLDTKAIDKEDFILQRLDEIDRKISEAQSPRMEPKSPAVRLADYGDLLNYCMGYIGEMHPALSASQQESVLDLVRERLALLNAEGQRRLMSQGRLHPLINECVEIIVHRSGSRT